MSSEALGCVECGEVEGGLKSHLRGHLGAEDGRARRWRCGDCSVLLVSLDELAGHCWGLGHDPTTARKLCLGRPGLVSALARLLQGRNAVEKAVRLSEAELKRACLGCGVEVRVLKTNGWLRRDAMREHLLSLDHGWVGSRQWLSCAQCPVDAPTFSSPRDVFAHLQTAHPGTSLLKHSHLVVHPGAEVELSVEMGRAFPLRELEKLSHVRRSEVHIGRKAQRQIVAQMRPAEESPESSMVWCEVCEKFAAGRTLYKARWKLQYTYLRAHASRHSGLEAVGDGERLWEEMRRSFPALREALAVDPSLFQTARINNSANATITAESGVAGREEDSVEPEDRAVLSKRKRQCKVCGLYVTVMGVTASSLSLNRPNIRYHLMSEEHRLRAADPLFGCSLCGDFRTTEPHRVWTHVKESHGVEMVNRTTKWVSLATGGEEVLEEAAEAAFGVGALRERIEELRKETAAAKAKQTRQVYEAVQRHWQSANRTAQCAKCRKNVVIVGKNGHISSQSVRNHCLSLEHNLERPSAILSCGVCEDSGAAAFEACSVEALWEHAGQQHGKNFTSSGIKAIARLTEVGKAAAEEETERCFRLSEYVEAFRRYCQTKRAGRRAVAKSFEKRQTKLRATEASKAERPGSALCVLCQRWFLCPQTAAGRLKSFSAHVLRAHVDRVRQAGSHWDVVRQCFPSHPATDPQTTSLSAQ